MKLLNAWNANLLGPTLLALRHLDAVEFDVW